MQTATLNKEYSRRWWDFWASADVGQLNVRVNDHVAHILDGDELVAEFTPDNAPEFISEVLVELQAA